MVEGGMTRDERIKRDCKLWLEDVGSGFSQAEINSSISRLKAPKGYPDDPERKLNMGFNVPLNVFLSQELQRMDKITGIIKKTFTDILEAIDGQILMTPAIVDAMDCLFNNKVPSSWLHDPSGAQISWMKNKMSAWFESFHHQEPHAQPVDQGG